MREASTRPGGLKKVLGPIDLILMGIGAMVGTGIFVLTAAAPARRVRHWRFPSWWPPLRVASPPCAMRNSLPSCRWLAASTPYSYAILGEIVAWMIGWDLILEYGLVTSAVSVGWSGYFPIMLSGFGLHLPVALSAAPGADSRCDPPCSTCRPS